MPEDIVDLILEPTGQHLVGLVQHKLLDVVRPKHQQYHLLRLNFFFIPSKKCSHFSLSTNLILTLANYYIMQESKKKKVVPFGLYFGSVSALRGADRKR